jgi:hypothetical protein
MDRIGFVHEPRGLRPRHAGKQRLVAAGTSEWTRGIHSLALAATERNFFAVEGRPSNRSGYFFHTSPTPSPNQRVVITFC